MDFTIMNANFLTGPVALKQEVQAAFLDAPLSHREPAFMEMMSRTRNSLNALVNASNVVLLVGSGTLANDSVAAQLKSTEGSGLVLSNGEFGDRLVDHARRWGLSFAVELCPWGRGFDWPHLRRVAEEQCPTWIWAVLAETSTGVVNPLAELLALCRGVNANLCLDAISAIGLMPVNLHGVRFATAVSGKGLAAFPGLAAVFHDGHLASSGQVPRYLDLANYEATGSVPFTHSSNLLAALDCSLALTQWTSKFETVRRESRTLRADLRMLALPPLAEDSDAAPGIVTLALPEDVIASEVAVALSALGFQVAFQSGYLQQRNWIQICLMGELHAIALRQLPAALASQVRIRRKKPLRSAI
jgi:aspartate aminotransferase-like enzyme